MNKKNLILLIVIVILTIFIVVWKNTGNGTTLTWDTLDSQITKIVLTNKGIPLVIVKQNKKWSTESKGYIVQNSIVESILAVMTNEREFELVSENTFYGKYKLDKENVIFASIFNQSNMLRSLKIGKVASTYRHTFVMLSSSSNIFQTKDNLTTTFNKEVKDIRNKEIVRFDKLDILKLKITEKSGKTATLTKMMKSVPLDLANTNAQAPVTPTEEWNDEKNNIYDSDKISAIINTFSTLNCDSFIDTPLAQLQSEKALFSIEVETAENKYSLTLLKNDDNYRAFSSERKYGFIIGKATGDNLLTTLNKIKK